MPRYHVRLETPGAYAVPGSRESTAHRRAIALAKEDFSAIGWRPNALVLESSVLEPDLPIKGQAADFSNCVFRGSTMEWLSDEKLWTVHVAVDIAVSARNRSQALERAFAALGLDDLWFMDGDEILQTGRRLEPLNNKLLCHGLY